MEINLNLAERMLRRDLQFVFRMGSLLTGVFLFSLDLDATLFVKPDAPWVENPQQELVQVQLSGGSVESAQAHVDNARKIKPDAFIILELNGVLQVGSKPLSLGSKMGLRLSDNSGISADESSSAPCLIAVEKSESVFISSSGPVPGILNGRGKVAAGIRMEDSIRVNVDRLMVINCVGPAIDIKGRIPAVVNEASSVTRSVFIRNLHGLAVENSAGFMCLDNVFQHQKGAAVVIKSMCSIIAGNTFDSNALAIRSGSDREVITRNWIGKGGGIEFLKESSGILVSENWSGLDGMKIMVDGRNHQFFRNSLPGTMSFSPSCGEVICVANQGLRLDNPPSGLKYFNPPTLNVPHKDTNIIPGMGRLDLSLPGGKPIKKEVVDAAGKKTTVTEKAIPVDISHVQQEIDKARKEHPMDVIVLNLEGEYVSRNPQGLLLPDNTCVILNGRIRADLGIPPEPEYVKDTPLTQVVAMPAQGFGSFSGGKLDGARQAFHPVNASSNSVILVEGVALCDGARDGFYVKARGRNAPAFIYQCSVSNNLGRGIWAHVASRIHSIANTCSGNRMDGIDMDAYSSDSTALFNTSSNNGRHGIFIEEAVKNQIAFGNTLTANAGSGVHVWNEEIKGNTGANVVAANYCVANRRGISCGGRAKDITANYNFFFNNVCIHNQTDGVCTGNINGNGNYYSQCVVRDNFKNEIYTPSSSQYFMLNDTAAASR